jgi:DNA-binding transcriptional regulator YiaG
MNAAEVRAQRKAWGLSQAQFADVLGVHKRTVAAWEQSKEESAVPDSMALLIKALAAISAGIERKRAEAD